MWRLNYPLEYDELSAYFDLWNINEQTRPANLFVEHTLKKHGAKTVLDMTCGTGSQVFWLLNEGFDVTGLDLSPKLLAIAKRRANKEGNAPRFIHGDMRTSKAGRFDAVITIFNAVGHLTCEDFERAMRNIRANLNDGGLYIFDILNKDAWDNNTMGVDESMQTLGDTRFHHIQHSRLNHKNGRLYSYDRFRLEGSKGTRTLRSSFALQLYSAEELKDMLTRNGFDVVGQYAIDGQAASAKTLRLFNVARAVSRN